MKLVNYLIYKKLTYHYLSIDHLSNTTLSSIVNVFMKSYEKGTEGTDMALELEDESVQHITDNDINIIDTIQIDETNKAIDNEDEIDQMVDQLSDIDDDIEQK